MFWVFPNIISTGFYKERSSEIFVSVELCIRLKSLKKLPREIMMTPAQMHQPVCIIFDIWPNIETNKQFKKCTNIQECPLHILHLHNKKRKDFIFLFLFSKKCFICYFDPPIFIFSILKEFLEHYLLASCVQDAFLIPNVC